MKNKNQALKIANRYTVAMIKCFLNWVLSKSHSTNCLKLIKALII